MFDDFDGLEVASLPEARIEPLPELDYAGPISLPGQPTDALPGTEEKIRILTERASRGEALFHPKDRPGVRPRPGEVPPPEPGWLQFESA